MKPDLMLRMAKEGASQNMCRLGKVAPIMMISHDDENEEFGMMPLGMENEHEKDFLSMFMQNLRKEKTSFIFITEVWMAEIKVPKKDEEFVRPKDHPDKKEKVMMVVSHPENGEKTFMASIFRENERNWLGNWKELEGDLTGRFYRND